MATNNTAAISSPLWMTVVDKRLARRPTECAQLRDTPDGQVNATRPARKRDTPE